MTITRSATKILLVVGILFALFTQSTAHTYLSSVYLGGTALAAGDCVRPHPASAFDSPIPLVTQADMTCGWLPSAATAANRKCPITAGSTIGIQWHHNSAAATDDIIDPSHKGPVMVYLANSATGSGKVWFKIYEDGYANGAWGVDRLLANKGRVDVKIPTDIAPGNYLLRGEIIALHSASALNGAQPYVGCVELTITGSGSAIPAAVALPGAYSPTDPGLLFNLYTTITSYVIPGPSVYTSGSSSSSSSGSSSPTSAPTSKPSSAPTSKPTSNPSSAPTTKPTSTPTTKPTSAPTSAPSGGTVKLQTNSGSNVWWFAVAVSGGSQTTTKVELMDSGSVSSFVTLTQASYGFYYSQSKQLTLPLSLRLTSSSGAQIVLSKIITSWTATALVDTGKNFGSASGAAVPSSPAGPIPTVAPTDAPTDAPIDAPTDAPVDTPTDAPSSGSVVLTGHSGTSEWWFSVTVSGVDADEIASVELKDSSFYSSFTFLTSGYNYYYFATTGKALVAPITVRVTSVSGQSVTGDFTTIATGVVVDTGASL
jgi:cellulase